MANPTATSPPAARPLHEVCEAARRANCGHCWQIPGLPCVTSTRTGRDGYHVARFARAMRRGLISGPELIAALAVARVFTNATVIYGGTAPDAFGTCGCGRCCCWRGADGPDNMCGPCRAGSCPNAGRTSMRYRRPAWASSPSA